MKQPCWPIRGLCFTTMVTKLLTVFQDAKPERDREIMFRINLLLGQNSSVYQIYLKKQHENTFHQSTRSRFEPNISRTGLANYYCASLLFNRHHTQENGTAVTP